jgi:putative ABC transport system permease protein
MEQVLNGSIARQNFNMLLLGVFAALALVLAAVGIYGVMAYSVGQRMHEIGIRMALGAGRGAVAKLIVGQGMTLALAGVLVGLGGAFGLTRLLAGLLFGVRPTDAATFVGVSLLLLAVALAACCLPARRAMRVDPIITLRYE